ncbi:MAG: hypothetical protein CL908_15915 [Deltaproteobacteria bacterium]|nr:hypothetical protein [Deltaproteobacteria bacterium]
MLRSPNSTFSILILLFILPTWAAPQEKPPKPKPKQEEPPQSEEWKKKWTTDPALADPRWQQAVAFRRKGDVDGAIKLYEEFLDANPDEVSVLISMGMAYWEKGALDEGEKWLREAKKVVPQHIKARQFLGQLLLHRGRFTEARKEFEELAALPWNRPDVKASAHLNLGRIALVKRQWKRADQMFFESGRSPQKGDRFSGKKGRRLTRGYKKTVFWTKVETKHLHIWFSPEIKKARDRNARQAWANVRERSFSIMCQKLGVKFPEPWPVYCFNDLVDCYTITGAEDIHDWKYSWWIISDGWSEPIGHQLAHQVVARVAGGRPANKILVEGLCHYVDGHDVDPHAAARLLLKKGRLRTIASMHLDQSYRLKTARPYGESFVAWLIDTYGMERFLRSYRWYNNVLLDQGWRRTTNLDFRWNDALSEVFGRGIGQGLGPLEERWRAFLSR